MLRVQPSRFAGVVAVAVVAVALAGACSSDGGGAEPLDASTVESQGCDDWNAASAQERAGLVSDLGYPTETASIPDVTGLIVEGVDNFCSSPDAEAELGLGGAISGTALAIGVQPAP